MSRIRRPHQEQLAAEEALLLGRQTFEDVRGYWPLQTDETTGVTAHLDQVQEFVVTSSTADPGWQNTELLHGPLEDEVRERLAQGGGELRSTGSIGVLHPWARADGRRIQPGRVPDPVQPRPDLGGSRPTAAAAEAGRLPVLPLGVVLQSYARG